ncbi:phosphatase PAP2 family protein [Herbaspirillum sp. HC18]|nr:phosphatase PAP2 family protein [Herbaspirillum sp. HC18]
MKIQPDSLWTWVPPCVALLLIAAIMLTGSNQAIFLTLNHIGHNAGENWWANLTILGDGAVALILVLPAIRRTPRRFWAALFAGLIVAIWIQAWKHMLPLPRPLSVFPADAFYHVGPQLRAVAFPSGHAATIFTLAGAWIIGVQGRYLARSLLLMLAVLVALSRIMVGVHWPLDVLTGMLVGWMGAYIGLWLSTRLDWKTSNKGGYLAGSMLLLLAVSLMFSRHTGYADAFTFQRILGLVCLIAGAWEMYLLPPAPHMRLQST